MPNKDCLYMDSYLSEVFGDLNLSGKNISSLMQTIGRQRDKIVSFMKKFIAGSEHVVFDMTDIISSSKKIGLNTLGRVESGFDFKMNLLYMFSTDKTLPVYYRVLPGNIKDVSSLRLSIEEIGIKSVTIVADKGFSSRGNIELLHSINANFILPLKRNDSIISYDKLRLNAPGWAFYS